MYPRLTILLFNSENTRDVLLECASARLKNNELSGFGGRLPSSSNLILLQGQPG